jgi:putative ATP-dependent endonuclease of OLD family
MWISQVSIQNFRKIKQSNEATFRFKEGVNLLVGENNVGKTTLVEAIALCLSFGKNDKYIFWSEEDFNDKKYPIQIKLHFSELTEPQQARFHQALINTEDPDVSKWELVLTFRVFLVKGRINSRISLGNEEEKSSNAFDLLNDVCIAYLPALRDVKLDFQPGKKNRVSKLLRKDFKETEATQILEIFKKANEDAMQVSGATNPMVVFKSKTNEYLTSLTIKGHDNRILLQFVEHEFEKILDSIAVYLAEYGIPIGANGLGYNNLIYIAVLLSKFKQELPNNHQFYCLIIEEPEAHLHPQLQTLLLDFLQKEYGGVQIILTSHSPTVTAALHLDNLLVLNGITSVLIKESGISDKHKKILAKYLDVTKSQLFFARRLVFVEGISEAFLIRRLWDLFFVANPENQFNRQGVEIVNIGGVSFAPYVELLKYVFSHSSIRSALITDDDRGTGRDCPSEYRFLIDEKLRDRETLETIFDNAPSSARFRDLYESIHALSSDGIENIGIFAARKTLEVELGMSNPDKVKSMLGLVGIDVQVSDNITPLAAGLMLWDELDARSKKADFYMNLVESNLIEHLTIPPYIQQAINFLNESTN